ncbi:nuclear factor related to kappa-B-binding protein isoform X2 [Pectinophora gossypiella]|uniref:nuclear factor related to kappa-B-binding protein isoform X2 n=1 Tax=Pectinophora gossypiella TaxID=13191 RepID=UPI00214E2086|nr:nuclear factor related to kappa-B-binding protein isoform X2 [Pectinophora gossypiella]
MADKAESEHSDSSESSSSSSESAGGSSEGEEEVMEPVTILGHTLELPQELCEDYGVFKEFFSMKTWDSLSDEHKEHLKQFLPSFPENDDEEKEKTVKMLFNFEPFHFTSPLDDFFSNLRQGNYRPDIAKMRKFLMKARAKQQKHKIKAYYAKLLPEVLLSRERLLAAAKAAPPGPVPALQLLPPKPSSKSNYKPLYMRARQRYFEELSAIRSEVGGEESEDDNYPEGPPEQYIRKRRHLAAGQSSSVDGSISGTLGAIDASNPTSLECLKNVLAAHRSRRQFRENHPELSTTGITLDDIKQRVALVNGAKKLMFGGAKNDAPVQKKRGPKKDPSQKQLKQAEAKGGKKKEEPETVENKPLLPNIKIKCEQEESDSESSSFVDPVASPKGKRPFDQVEIKQEIVDNKYPVPNINYNEPNLESMIKQEPPDLPMQNSRGVQPVPIKLEDLDGIDMMALPVEIADDTGDVMQVDSNDADELLDPDEALTETTHASFLSLVRALFPARAAHRASKHHLHARCAAVMRSPIAPLNTWYNLSDDWCAELDSALSFLAGERGPHPDDFVPYLQFMPESQVYQWIGAGRDCDALLGRLCERWLHAAEPPPPPAEPPPPKYPTSWVVRTPTNAEIAEFRAQERKRFASAAKPFTYVQFGYRSVVGPLARTSGAGGAGAALLLTSRPRHASFPALLRDAVARLPNGEGTRHDVVTLMKMSQWIAPCTDQSMLSAVSSGLDRMHSAKRDPIVKYDQRTAIWTYLHRHRSEEDWVKSGSGRGRGGRMVTPGLPPPQPLPQPPPPPQRAVYHTPPHAMEMEVASIEEVVDNGSDTDVDVDDSSAPASAPRLSSAQLLMQQAQAQPTPPPAKHKSKLVAVSPKPKPTKPEPKPPPITQPKPVTQPPKPALPGPSKSNLIAAPKPSTSAKQAPPQKPIISMSLASLSPKQSHLVAKQASLMAQSAKQANVMAQLTKQVVAKQANVIQSKQVNVVKQTAQSPKQTAIKPPVVQQPKHALPVKATTPSQVLRQETPKQVQALKAPPPIVAAPQKSPLIKQRPLQKQVETVAPVSAPSILAPQAVLTPSVMASVATVAPPNPAKLVQGTRSLLIRAPPAQTTVTAAVSTPTSQVTPTQRRGIVRVLSPATPSGGKSLISPRALMQQGAAAAKKRSLPQEATSVTTVAQSAASVTTVVSSVPTAVSSSLSTRTVQLAGGRTVQLAAAPHAGALPASHVQLAGHTLQLSSLQLPTHSVRLPSGQTVQLASPQTIRAVSTATVKTSSPRTQPSSPTVKPTQTSVQIPISSVQLAGQTVQIGGQTVQLAGQSVQLTGHTVKLPSGQSVQVASQSVQLPSGQTVQLAGGSVQTVQLGQNVLTNQVASGVQLSGQTVQLAGGQTVQLPSGQTVQLPSGQTLQLSGTHAVQLAGAQAAQLAAQQRAAQLARSQQPSTDKAAQPIVAKLLTNAQGQMISLEGGGGGRALQVSGVRVVGPARPRPLLLAAGKPLHNVILQQGDGSTIRVTSTGGAATSQTIVLSSLGGQTSTTSTASPPVLKLQQVNPLQQVKLPHGIKLHQVNYNAVSSAGVTGAGGVRGVVMEAQQLKLVGGRHVLARILRPAQPHQQHQPPQ